MWDFPDATKFRNTYTWHFHIQYLYVGFFRSNKIVHCSACTISEKAIRFRHLDYLSTSNISFKSMHAFLSNLANRQTDRQTDKRTRAKTCTSSFVGGTQTYTAPWRPKIQKRLEDRELNQARSKPDTVDRPVRTARTIVHRYNSTQYCSTETVLLIFPFLQTNITSQRRLRGAIWKDGIGCIQCQPLWPHLLV